MGQLVEVVHVSLGGQIDPLDWAMPYLDDEHLAYAGAHLAAADALLLGRRTYQGLCSAYPRMPSNPFVDRMNAIPKYVASRTLTSAGWNASVIPGEVAAFVADLKQRRGLHLIKYGHGPLDAALMERGLIDEFHVLLAPVAAGQGRRLFAALEGALPLRLVEARPWRSGVVLLVYRPPAA